MIKLVSDNSLGNITPLHKTIVESGLFFAVKRIRISKLDESYMFSVQSLIKLDNDFRWHWITDRANSAQHAIQISQFALIKHIDLHPEQFNEVNRMIKEINSLSQTSKAVEVVNPIFS
ncbi:hypothetical protein AB4254_08930 [Vibrio breoganii]